MKKHAFTLAETLITLTIIGVVAAMTIPTLMNKYQDQALKSQFKKAYNILNQAVAISGQDYLCYIEEDRAWLNDGYKTAQCQAFWENVLRQLKYTKSEKVTNDSWLYKTIAQVKEGGGYSSVTYESYVKDLSSNLTKYYMADGSTLYISPKPIGSNWLASHSIKLDVNGDKGPNKWGYDVFLLEPVKRLGGQTTIYDFSAIYEKGGKRPKNILLGID